MTKKIIPSLANQINEVQNQLHTFVTQEDLISLVSSWYVRYDCEIDCSEELKENLRINVTFDNHSYGTYVSKSHPLEKAMQDIEDGYKKWLKINKEKQAKREETERNNKILELIQQGKITEAAELSKSSCPVS